MIDLVSAGAVWQLGARIRAVEGVPSEDGDTVAVRRGLGRLATIHHVGLAFLGGVALPQMILVIGW